MLAYKKVGNFENQEQLVSYLPLVKRVAHAISKHLPASIELSDLVQTGVFGLMDALKNYNDSKKDTFEAYAMQRIRGSILDDLRKEDLLPRDLRKQVKSIQQKIHFLEQKLGRAPKEHEVAEALSWNLTDYQHILGLARAVQLVHLDDMNYKEHEIFESIEEDSGTNPREVFEHLEFRKFLTEQISRLPERDQLLMGLYYEEELNLREIAAILGISESRVSQLHTQIILRLKRDVREEGWDQP